MVKSGAKITLMAEEPNSLSVYQLATPRPPFEVMVLDAIAVEGLPDPKRIPIILSSNGIEADAAIDVFNCERAFVA